MTENLAADIERSIADEAFEHADELFESFLLELESGSMRAAYPDGDAWHVNSDVKKLILLGFRIGRLEEHALGDFQFCDKHNLWPSRNGLAANRIRIVPGGTSVRRGAYLAGGVTIMPPAYVNIGAYIGTGSMIDSHALVGSCAQIGAHCHISAAAQIGGVLEPVGAMPVIVEDDVFVGGGCGLYEGVHVHRRAVLAAGTIITSSTPVYDLARGRVIRTGGDGVIHIPEDAVVIPGSRAINSAFAREFGLSAYAPLIVKYRDSRTDASVALEEALR